MFPTAGEIRKYADVPKKDYYVSGHRTCRACGPALAMKLIAKVAGPRTVVLGSTGCMYVANTSYYTTPWAFSWIHTQLGAIGSATLGTSSGIIAQMRKGKLKKEKIYVIGIAGDGGGADMGLGPISSFFTYKVPGLIVIYDNESYANTGIQASCMTPWGALTTFSPGGKERFFHTRRKKNIMGIVAAHEDVRYIASATPVRPFDFMTKVRKALAVDGPTFLYVHTPCPKGWEFPERDFIKVGRLAIDTGIIPMYEIVDGKARLTYVPRERKPVGEYLRLQGRFYQLTDADIKKIQKDVVDMWENWLIPGIVPLVKQGR